MLPLPSLLSLLDLRVLAPAFNVLGGRWIGNVIERIVFFIVRHVQIVV